MSTINRVPYNSTIIDRIFSQMPAGFSSDPIEQDAVVFSAESNNLFKNATVTNVAPYITSNFSTVQNGASTYVNTALPIIIDGTLVSGANSASFSSYRMTVLMSSTTSSTNTSPIVGQSFSAYIANSGKIVSGVIESIIGQTLYVIIPNLSFFVNNEIPSSPLSISEVYCSSSLDVSKISFYISDSTLTISSDESAILSENIDLENYTIESLIYYFNNRYSGKSSQLLLKLADSAPSTLLEMSASILSEGSSSLEDGIIVWPRFTSQNYSLLMMFALIIKTYKKLIIGAINQTDHRLASKDWLEHWGSILGVPRSSYEQFALETSEPDIIYRERMRREVMLPKVSNESIKYLTSQATGRAISVSDGGQPFLLYSSENTLPVVVNKGYTSGEITASDTTVSGLGSAFLTDFPIISTGNYGKLIIDTKGYSEARQVTSVSTDNTLTLSSPFSNTYTNTPIYYDSSASVASSTLTSCLIYAAASSTTLTVGATQFGSIVSGKTYTYDTGSITFLGNPTFKSTPVSGYCSGSTFTVTNTYPASISGTISGNVLRVTAISSGQIVTGQLFIGTGVTANSIVTAFGTGTGGLGTYYLSQSSTVTTTTSMIADATVIVGQKLSGVGIPDGVFITGIITGSGGIGTYTISPSNYSGYCAFTASVASYTMNVTAISSGSLQVGQTILTGLSDTSTTIVSISKGASPNIYVCILSKSASVIATSLTAAKSVDNLICFAKQYTLLSAPTAEITPVWKLARASTPIFTASSNNAILTPGLTLAGVGVDSSTKIVGPKIIAATSSGSITGKTFSFITKDGNFAAGYGLMGDDIVPGTFFTTATTVNRVYTISSKPMVAISGTWAQCPTGSIAGTVLTAGGTQVNTFYPGMSIFVNAIFTATISSSTMTVSAVSEGTLAIGMVVTGFDVPTNTVITALGTGTTGGIGTYTISTSATISSRSMMAEFILPPNTKIVSQSSSNVFNLSASVSASFTASFSNTTMTVTAVSAGTLDIGQIVTGTGVTANSVIIAFGTGAGGVGTYTLSQTSSPTGVSCTATKTITSKQIQGWKSGTEWIVSASSSVGPIPITASTVGYQHKKAASGTPALTDAAALSYFLGPSTGGGSFSVTVPLADGETTVSQKVLSFVRLLVSKYKPAGIPYTIN